MNPHPRATRLTPAPHDGVPPSALGLPVEQVFRPEIALPLKFGLHVCTVGGLLGAWGDADRREQIEQIFDDPDQAAHAIDVCAAWIGHGPPRPSFTPPAEAAWWAE